MAWGDLIKILKRENESPASGRDGEDGQAWLVFRAEGRKENVFLWPIVFLVSHHCPPTVPPFQYRRHKATRNVHFFSHSGFFIYLFLFIQEKLGSVYEILILSSDKLKGPVDEDVEMEKLERER